MSHSNASTAPATTTKSSGTLSSTTSDAPLVHRNVIDERMIYSAVRRALQEHRGALVKQAASGPGANAATASSMLGLTAPTPVAGSGGAHKQRRDGEGGPSSSSSSRGDLRVGAGEPFDVSQDPEFVQAGIGDLRELHSLILSFQNILVIDNLGGLESLTKLQLDNNAIERIEGLEHLVNLTWLDLSFNSIRRIEGLDTLTKLTDLSLASNQIETVSDGGLEELTKLEVLSLSGNRIDSLADVEYLRTFKHLRLLTLSDNPVASHDEFRDTVLAFLPSLKYLDYKLIPAEAKANARDQMDDRLRDLEEEELQLEEHEREAALLEEQHKEAAAANLEGVTDLFQRMLDADKEHNRLRAIPGYDGIVQQYEQLFEAGGLNDFIEEMKLRHAGKERELALFRSAIDEARETNASKSIELVQAFDARKKQVERLFAESVAAKAPSPAILRKLEGEVDALVENLMDLEMLMVEQMNEVISRFEDEYLAMCKSNEVLIHSTFASLADVTKTYEEKLRQRVKDVLTEFQNGDLEDDPDLNALLSDKDIVKTAVDNSHDCHLKHIEDTSDKLVEREAKRAAALIQGIKDDEYERNRTRVTEIYDLAMQCREHIQTQTKGASSG